MLTLHLLELCGKRGRVHRTSSCITRGKVELGRGLKVMVLIHSPAVVGRKGTALLLSAVMPERLPLLPLGLGMGLLLLLLLPRRRGLLAHGGDLDGAASDLAAPGPLLPRFRHDLVEGGELGRHQERVGDTVHGVSVVLGQAVNAVPPLPNLVRPPRMSSGSRRVGGPAGRLLGALDVGKAVLAVVVGPSRELKIDRGKSSSECCQVATPSPRPLGLSNSHLQTRRNRATCCRSPSGRRGCGRPRHSSTA